MSDMSDMSDQPSQGGALCHEAMEQDRLATARSPVEDKDEDEAAAGADAWAVSGSAAAAIAYAPVAAPKSRTSTERPAHNTNVPSAGRR